MQCCLRPSLVFSPYEPPDNWCSTHISLVHSDTTFFPCLHFEVSISDLFAHCSSKASVHRFVCDIPPRVTTMAIHVYDGHRSVIVWSDRRIRMSIGSRVASQWRMRPTQPLSPTLWLLLFFFDSRATHILDSIIVNQLRLSLSTSWPHFVVI